MNGSLYLFARRDDFHIARGDQASKGLTLFKDRIESATGSRDETTGSMQFLALHKGVNLAFGRDCHNAIGPRIARIQQAVPTETQARDKC